MYVQSDERASGLIHLMSIDLRWLTLIEFGVRQHLADRKKLAEGHRSYGPVDSLLNK